MKNRFDDPSQQKRALYHGATSRSIEAWRKKVFNDALNTFIYCYLVSNEEGNPLPPLQTTLSDQQLEVFL